MDFEITDDEDRADFVLETMSRSREEKIFINLEHVIKALHQMGMDKDVPDDAKDALLCGVAAGTYFKTEAFFKQVHNDVMEKRKILSSENDQSRRDIIERDDLNY